LTYCWEGEEEVLNLNLECEFFGNDIMVSSRVCYLSAGSNSTPSPRQIMIEPGTILL